MNRSKYFNITELVAPEILSVLTEDCAWRLFPGQIIPMLDLLRVDYGAAVTINGNGLRYCGLRPQNCTEGALRSSHKGFGDVQGFDLHCADMDKMRKLITVNNRKYGIVRMENPAATKTWIHVEISMNPVVSDLVVFNP